MHYEDKHKKSFMKRRKCWQVQAVSMYISCSLSFHVTWTDRRRRYFFLCSRSSCATTPAIQEEVSSSCIDPVPIFSCIVCIFLRVYLNVMFYVGRSALMFVHGVIYILHILRITHYSFLSIFLNVVRTLKNGHLKIRDW